MSGETTNTVLKLKEVTLDNRNGFRTLSGVVNDNTLYFRVPSDFTLVETADPFLAALLPVAMYREQSIVIQEGIPVSRKLVESCLTIEDILALWYRDMKKVEVTAKTRPTEMTPLGNVERAALFSGGVDAAYTLIKHADNLSHLIYVRGIDTQLDADILWEQCRNTNEEIAKKYGKILVPMESNVRFFCLDLGKNQGKKRFSWYEAQGGGLASVALALGFPITYISSSNAYDALHPLGSHPLTDPLWSTEKTEIIHDGCELRRHEKIKRIAKDDFVLKRLRVCWQDQCFNCGRCDKCLHFRMALRLLDLETFTLQPIMDLAELRGADVSTAGQYVEWMDNLILAKKVGDRSAIRALEKILNRYRIRTALKLIDEAWFNGQLIAINRRFRQSKKVVPRKRSR